MINDFVFNNSYDGLIKLDNYKQSNFWKKSHPELETEITYNLNKLIEEENKKSEKEFITTCVKYDKGYRHFGIRKCTCGVFGEKKEDIISLKLKKSDNQERIYGDYSYWGYFDISDGEYTLIYQSLVCLTVCFPTTMNVYENCRQGLFVKLDAIEELPYLENI